MGRIRPFIQNCNKFRLAKCQTCSNSRLRPKADFRYLCDFMRYPMLSQQTLQFLDDLTCEAHVAYPQGGVLWTYVESANQAHSKFVNPRRKPEAHALDFNKLGSSFEAALGSRSSVTERSSSRAKELISFLQADLGIDSFLCGFEDDSDDMTANIYMMRASDNRYFALELWWSVD